MSSTPLARPARHVRFVSAVDGLIDRLFDRAREVPFLVSLRGSLITIHALLLREAKTRYGRRSAGYVWAVIEPLLQMGAMMTVFAIAGRRPAVGDSIIVFFMTGIMPLMLIRGALTRGAKAIDSNRALMNYPQVRGFHVVTARVLLEALTSVVVVFLVMMFGAAFLDLPVTAWISAPLELLEALGTLLLLAYGVCFLSAEIGRFFSQWADLMSATSRLLFFTSGLWYTLDTLPPGIRKFVGYNPLAQMIEWIRDASIPGFESLHFHPWYPLSFAVGCLFVGLFLEWLYRVTGMDLDSGR